jgi:hypothetical protein
MFRLEPWKFDLKHYRFDRAIGSDTRRCRKRRYSDDAVTSSSKRLACYQMNRRFDLSTIESFSEIPACRAREVLFLLIEVDPISGKECEQYPEAYPKEYRERVERFSRNYIWRKITGDITIDFLEATSSSLKRFIADTTTSRYPQHRAKIPELLHEFFLKNREHLRPPARVR